VAGKGDSTGAYHHKKSTATNTCGFCSTMLLFQSFQHRQGHPKLPKKKPLVISDYSPVIQLTVQSTEWLNMNTQMNSTEWLNMNTQMNSTEWLNMNTQMNSTEWLNTQMNNDVI